MRAVCCILIFFCGQLYAQDVCMQPQQQGWIRVGQSTITSNMFFDSNGDRIPIRTNSLYTTSIGGEYAFSNRVAVTFFAPVFVRTTINAITFKQSGMQTEGRAVNSIGDSEVGLRVKVAEWNSLQALGFVKLGLPLGKKNAVGTDADLQTGDGEFNQIVGLQLLYPLQAGNYFLSGYCAYNNRAGDFSEEIRFGFSLTYYGSHVRAMARLNSIETLFNKTGPVSLNGIFSNHREFISPGIEVEYKASKRTGFFAAVDFYPTGRNTLATSDIIVGLSLAFE